jgi:hypothetical protein
MKRIIILVFVFLTVNAANSQSVLKDKCTDNQKVAFSKSLSLLEQSSFMNSIIQGSNITILLPDDYATTMMTSSFYDQLFNQRSLSTIDFFFKRYTLSDVWTKEKILSGID